MTETNLKELRYGHSPDPDDAYMFYGFATGDAQVPGYKIVHVIEEIEALNARADKAELEITAMSAHAYAYLHDKYRIMSCGSSMGRDYGPVVVAKSAMTASELEGKTVAVPGSKTTAALLAGIYLPAHKQIAVPFDQTFDAVSSGKADAAVIIHEGQLTYESLGFKLVCDLAACWRESAGSLPLPLGLDTVRRDMGDELSEQICSALRDSILCAKKDGKKAFDYALKWGRGISEELNEKFVGMYVNDDTIDMKEDGVKALETLFRLGREKGILPAAEIPVDLIK